MAKSKDSGGGDGSSAAGVQKVKKPKPPYNLLTAIRSALRTAWRENPTLQEVLKRERIERPYIKKDGSTASKPRVFYTCYVCKHTFPRKVITIDHIDPVGPTPGSKLAPEGLTWDTFIQRLFCSASNLGTICETCHREKTNAETKERFRRLKDAG